MGQGQTRWARREPSNLGGLHASTAWALPPCKQLPCNSRHAAATVGEQQPCSSAPREAQPPHPVASLAVRSDGVAADQIGSHHHGILLLAGGPRARVAARRNVRACRGRARAALAARVRRSFLAHAAGPLPERVQGGAVVAEVVAVVEGGQG